MSINVTTGANGIKGLNELIVPMVLGARTIDKGQIRVIPNVNDTVEVSRFKAALNKLAAPVATPTGANANDALSKDFFDIINGEHMWYDEFNPHRDFKSDWEFLWQSGRSVDDAYNQLVRGAIQTEVIKSIRNNVEKLIWRGDTASADVYLQRTDGLIKLIKADRDTDVNFVTPAGSIGVGNVLSIMQDCINAMIDPMKENVDVTFLMNVNDYFKYGEATGDENIYKGQDVFDAYRARFRNIPIVTVDIPENHIVLTNTGTGRDSNIALSTWMSEDMNSFKMDRLQANSELWFAKALFKLGVNYAWGDQIVFYEPGP